MPCIARLRAHSSRDAWPQLYETKLRLARVMVEERHMHSGARHRSTPAYFGGADRLTEACTEIFAIWSGRIGMQRRDNLLKGHTPT